MRHEFDSVRFTVKVIAFLLNDLLTEICGAVVLSELHFASYSGIKGSAYSLMTKKMNLWLTGHFPSGKKTNCLTEN